jgi:hypothetical protein
MFVQLRCVGMYARRDRLWLDQKFLYSVVI